MRRAIEKHHVNVIGLTLSRNQAAYVQKAFDVMDTACSKRVLLQGWEQFDEPVDRIVSIGAFEHFGYDRYDDFFKVAYGILPDDGRMLLHTITALAPAQIVERGLPAIETVEYHSATAGFKLHRRQALQPHYATTLDHWAAALEAHHSEAVKIQSEEVYQRYMKYLTGCAKAFRIGYIDVNQFTLGK
jgi:cyclopropane-fatty-acyl-phospholipid synthase